MGLLHVAVMRVLIVARRRGVCKTRNYGEGPCGQSSGEADGKYAMS